MTTALQKINIDGFKALVFQMGNIRFAADLEQIDELIEKANWEVKEDDAIPLDRLMHLDQQPVIYKEPHIITINYQQSQVSVQIDQPEDITHIPIDAIRSFPDLVEKVRAHSWLWGIGLLNDEPILLIDCHKLAAECLKGQEAAWN